MIPIRDVILFGIATHKITSTATKDRVTSPLRAPFTHYEGSVGGGEVKESSRGEGLRHATGYLVTKAVKSGVTSLIFGAIPTIKDVTPSDPDH